MSHSISEFNIFLLLATPVKRKNITIFCQH
jgi:hypothetical protein